MRVTAVFLSKKNSNRKNKVINNIRESKEKTISIKFMGHHRTRTI